MTEFILPPPHPSVKTGGGVSYDQIYLSKSLTSHSEVAGGLCAILSSVKPRTRDGVDLGAACVYLGRLLCLLPREVRGRAEKLFLAPHRLVCGLQDVRRQQALRERAEEAEANKKAEVTTMS